MNNHQIDDLLVGIKKGNEIREMFPGKPGSSARRTTLIFLLSYWKIIVTYSSSKQYNGFYFNIITNSFSTGKIQSAANENIIVIEEPFKIAIVTNNKGIILNQETIFGIIAKKFDIEISKLEEIKKGLVAFTNAGHKSLIQKIIRFRSTYIEIGEKLYPSNIVLVVSFALLMINPGSFVPDIRRYVTGLESALKRLAICAFEDSYVDDENIEHICQLLMCSFLIQRFKNWLPTEEMVINWLILAENCFVEDRYLNYDIDRGLKYTPYVMTKCKNHYELSSALLDMIKSFPGDLNMVRDVAHNKKILAMDSNDIEQPEIMPLGHAIDQHWAPDIAYMYDYKFLDDILNDDDKPFKNLFEKIFKEVTGINSRKNYNKNFEKEKFVIETRKAQFYYLISKQNRNKTLRKISKDRLSFKYELDKSWIAGMVGAIEIQKRPSRYVTLNPSDLDELIVIKKPSRDMKTAELSIEEQESAKMIVKSMLQKGVSLNQCPAPIKLLDKSILVEKDGEFYIKKGNTNLLWDEVRKVKLEMKLHYNIKYDMEYMLTTIGDGVYYNMYDEIEKLYSKYPLNVLRKVYIYLNNFQQQIELNRLNRQGDGMTHSVSLDDIGAYHFLLELSVIIPGSLRLTDSIKFSIIEPIILWIIKDYIGKFIMEYNKINTNAGKWIQLVDKYNRKLWNHQNECLDEMIYGYENNKREIFYGYLLDWEKH